MKYIAYNRDINSYTKPIRMPQSSHCMYHGRFIPLSTFKECLHFKSVFLTFASKPFTRFHNLIFIQVSLDKLTSQYLTSRYKILVCDHACKISTRTDWVYYRVHLITSIAITVLQANCSFNVNKMQ